MSWEILKPKTPEPLSDVRVSCYYPANNRDLHFGISLPEEVMRLLKVRPTESVRVMVGREEHAGQIYIEKGKDWPIHRQAGCGRGRLVVPAPAEYRDKFKQVAVSLLSIESKEAVQVVLPGVDGSPRDLPVVVEVDLAAEGKSDLTTIAEVDSSGHVVNVERKALQTDDAPVQCGVVVTGFPRSENAKAIDIPLDIYLALPDRVKSFFDVLKWQEWAGASDLAMAGVPVLPLGDVEGVLARMMQHLEGCGLELSTDDGEWLLRAAIEQEADADGEPAAESEVEDVEPEPEEVEEPEPEEVEPEPEEEGEPAQAEACAANEQGPFELPADVYKKMKPMLRKFFDEFRGGGLQTIEHLRTLSEDGVPMSLPRCINFVATLRRNLNAYDLIIEKHGEAYIMKSWQVAVAENA